MGHVDRNEEERGKKKRKKSFSLDFRSSLLKTDVRRPRKHGHECNYLVPSKSVNTDVMNSAGMFGKSIKCVTSQLPPTQGNEFSASAVPKEVKRPS